MSDWRKDWHTLDLKKARVTLKQGSNVISDRVASHPHDDPWALLPQFVSETRKHVELRKGLVVTLGALTGSHDIVADREIVASVDGLGEARLTVLR